MTFGRVVLPITRQLRRFSTMVQDSGWRQVPATTEIPEHSVFLKAIEKPETDDRDYRLIRLQNGLQALLIHDPKADKAAAAMDVSVGHLSDPVSTCFFDLFIFCDGPIAWPGFLTLVLLGRRARPRPFL